MTDEINNDPPKKKASNVKPLHKGIKVQEEEKEVPVLVVQDVVDELRSILASAEKGEVIGLVYTTANKDRTSDYNIVGGFSVPDRTQNILRILDDDFYEFITRPEITGTFLEFDE